MMKNPASTWNSSGYELGTSVGNTKLSFSRQSQGIQNLFLLLLMKKRLEGSGIVFVEELEQNLEPKMQRYIADEYKKLGIGQLFITSHSPEIISHFEYSDISILHKETAISLLSGLDDLTVKKEIFRVNKKEFISALMAEKILLVEGESEYESFPIYSYQDNSSLSQNDVEMIKIGGKAKVDIYCKTFKHFGKKVYVLLDNDTDITATLNKVKDIADVVYLAMNSYEDIIFPYADKFLNKLGELLDFTVVKNKLVGIYNAISTDSKKTAVKNSMEADSIDPKLYMSYTDLASSKSVLEYVLHDSFATSYCARAVANFICEEKIVPIAYLNLIQHLSGKSQELNLHAGYSNVYELNG
jgi:predicted ATP-dependent endonuclease of OLD family